MEARKAREVREFQEQIESFNELAMTQMNRGNQTIICNLIPSMSPGFLSLKTRFKNVPWKMPSSCSISASQVRPIRILICKKWLVLPANNQSS